MCSTGGLILILLIALFYNCFYTVDSLNPNNSTPTTTTTTANVTASSSLGAVHSHSSGHSQGGHHPINELNVGEEVDENNDDDDNVGDFENVSWHASTATAAASHTRHDHVDDDGQTGTATTGADGGHYIDITRKHQIHYNGLVIDEDNLIEHLEEHEREMIFGKSRKKRSIKLVHLTYRPTAASSTKTATSAAAAHSADVADYDNAEGAELEMELQIPNNSLDTVTAAAVVHRSKRSDTESTTSAPAQTPNSADSGASALPPIVSVQIKDNDHLVNLKLQQTPKLIDDAFVFIRRYANTSQLVENSHKLAERLEKCFYHNENSALDLCDDENVRGVYHHNQTDYVIHPLPERFGNKTHIILETEKEIYDTLWSNSTVLDENIQFEPEMEEFNDLNIEAMADQENTTRSTRNIETEEPPQQRLASGQTKKTHHTHGIPLNLRFKPRHHHHQQQQEQQQYQHHQNFNNHHSQKRHSRLHHKRQQHHRQPLEESQKASKRSRRFISPIKDWRSPSDVLHIETAIFVDTDLYNHMTKNFPKDTSSHLIRFVLAMINGVQLLYHHPSLGRRVNFVLKRLEILEKDPLDLPRSSDIDIYLSNFCKWQTRWNSANDPKLHYDHAVILTGLDLYVVNKNGKLISQVVGLAPVAGMCIETSSCTINEGKHFESVFVVAHEIGHNLGMRHDSTENGCEPTSHIMSPTLGSGKITWSQCSRDSLNLFLEKSQAKCLFNRAEFTQNLDHSAEGVLPGERFDANQQCMLKYGKESTRARSQSLSDICRDLHCQRDRYTWTSHPALEGTACGDNMWCRSGFCVVKRIELYSAAKPSTSLSKINYDKSNFLDNSKSSNLLHEYQKPASSWSEWGEPSACDSSCIYGPSNRLREGSTGLKVFTRKCIDYKRRCIGRDRKFETCVAKQCYSVPMLTIADFAKQICERARKFDSDLTGEGEQISGNIEESCKIFCKTKSNGTKSRSWTFPDGTTCNSKLYSNDEPSYCIQGRCEKFSCDNSTANYYKIDNIFCKQQDKNDDNTMDNETIRRSSTSSSSLTHQSYSNQIPFGPPATQVSLSASSSYNNYDDHKYRSSSNQNYNYDHNTGSDRIYGPTTVRSKYENEVALKPFHGQFNPDAASYKRKSDNYSPWNKYSYHLNDHVPSESSVPKSPPSVAIAPSAGENEWIVKSGCHSSCMVRSKGIQVVMNRKTGLNNFQLCTHTVKPCERLQTTGDFADHTCSRYKLKVRGLSGHGIQIAASVNDPDRSCRVGCQDELIQHRFFLVNGNYGHFPLGTKCSNTEERYCVQGKCLEFGADQIPLKQSHISLPLFRNRRSAKKHQHVRNKRSFLYYDPVNITETLTQDFINNIVNSIITLEEQEMKDDSPLGHHIEFTNPINYSMDEVHEN